MKKEKSIVEQASFWCSPQTFALEVQLLNPLPLEPSVVDVTQQKVNKDAALSNVKGLVRYPENIATSENQTGNDRDSNRSATRCGSLIKNKQIKLNKFDLSRRALHSSEYLYFNCSVDECCKLLY